MQVIRAVGRALASRALAVILLITLAGVALVACLTAQLSAAGVRWAMPGPGLHPIVRVLQLNDIFQARWALGLVVALMVNLLLCTVARLRRPLLQPEQIRGLLHFRQVVTAMPVDESWLVIHEELKGRGFRIRSARGIGSLRWSARKNRLGAFGSALFHLSLLIAVAGFALRARKGFDGELVLFPDQTSELRLADGDTLQIQLVNVGTEYDFTPRTDDIRLRQRKSEVIVYHNRRFERSAVLGVNRPLRIRGVSLFQSDPAQIFIVRLIPTPQQRTAVARSGTRKQPVRTAREQLHPSRDTIIRIRENERFELSDAGSRGQFSFRTSRLGSLYLRDSLYGRLPVQAVLTKLDPVEEGRLHRRLVDTLRLDQPLAVADHTLSLLNIRQGSVVTYRSDPAQPWLGLAGAVFLLGILLRGFTPAWELNGTITEELGETVIRLGGRALGLFTSLRPLVNRIVDRLELP